MRAAKVQASLRIRAVSPEPSLLAHTSSESRGTFRQKARSLAPLNGWACAVKICHDGMLEDTNSLDGAQLHQEPFCIVKLSLHSQAEISLGRGSAHDFGDINMVSSPGQSSVGTCPYNLLLSLYNNCHRNLCWTEGRLYFLLKGTVMENYGRTSMRWWKFQHDVMRQTVCLVVHRCIVKVFTYHTFEHRRLWLYCSFSPEPSLFT